VREGDERIRVRQRDSSLLADLTDRSGAVRLGFVDAAAGEHPGAAHEPRLVRALDEQDFEALGAAAENDYRRRGARLGGLALVEDRARFGTVGHQVSLICARMSTETEQRWICESCGFIYDPEEGDPDGGIPPGTPFQDIPADWYCPVCGARKADFSPYVD
jgi:rubredoxin